MIPQKICQIVRNLKLRYRNSGREALKAAQRKYNQISIGEKKKRSSDSITKGRK